MDYYKCLNCGSIGGHNFDSYHDGDFGEALWTDYMESLKCDECGNSETVGGAIDDMLEIMSIDSWSKFIEVDKPEETKQAEPSSSLDGSIFTQEKFSKGVQGEKDFNSWLIDNKFSYLHINTSASAFLTLFKSNVKKPDFLLLLESIGMIAVDVKNNTPYRNSYTLNLGSDCFRSISFERLYRIPLWYAYKSEIDGETIWLWISAIKALEVGIISKNSRTDESFLRIDLKHFKEIKNKDDMKNLYSE